MNAAKSPRAQRESARLLVVDPGTGDFADSHIMQLPQLLEAGDLIIVNDAATLPASLRARSIEIRLAQNLGNDLWRAVLFGAGDWRTPTELRDPPPALPKGSIVEIAPRFSAEIIEVSPVSQRLVTIRFNRSGADLWSALYACGRPIQYAYHLNDLPLRSVQTVYAGRPWSMEMPSAGYPLTWAILLSLKRRGIKVAWLTHSAGLSSAGDDDVEASLPFTEHYEIPLQTVDAIASARRVIAVGTTVVRALEGSVRNNDGALRAGSGETSLIIGKNFQRTTVDAILTGLHDRSQSHFRLLHAFADEATLRRAWRHATEADYLCHEFGDLCLILPSVRVHGKEH